MYRPFFTFPKQGRQDERIYSFVFSSCTSSATMPPTTPVPTMSPWKGEEPRVYDMTCDDTVCPPDSYCLSDYDSGGSRCHCSLGRRGDFCSEGERCAVWWRGVCRAISLIYTAPWSRIPENSGCTRSEHGTIASL